MLELILGPIEGVAKEWEKEVARRRERTAMDAIADSMERDAAELRSVLGQIRRDFRMCTPEQFAPLVGKSERTVRRWCAEGRIPGAVQDAAGDWRIPSNARPHAKSA